MRKETTVCFSGHRPEKYPFLADMAGEAYLTLENRLEEAIFKSIDDGYKTFICGMAMGFDLIAGSLLVSLKESWSGLEDIHLAAILPFQGHGFSGHPWCLLHQMVLRQASRIITMPSHCPSKKAYHDRNRFMVDHSSRLICFYSGQKSGTDYTVHYAQRHGLEIINLYQ